jgi:tetraacyldisaccharide 4'-kinase
LFTKRSAPKFWYQPLNWKSKCLLLFSFFYRSVIFIRYQGYRLKFIKKKLFNIPIVIIGNVTVGGTGKTPLVIELFECLKQNGFAPGIVSRGYGGIIKKNPEIVNKDSSFKRVGDEAVLLAKKTNAPVVIGQDRPRAVELLLRHFNCNVIICDDGLQHYALERDIEIVVVDGERGFGNRQCLPAGPLREPLNRLNRVDFVIFNQLSQKDNDQKSYVMHLRLQQACSLLQPDKRLDLETLKGQVVHAVAGTGHPERFFRQLESIGIIVQPHSFPDHYFFQVDDFQFHDEKLILMTEKDAVKCHSFATERMFFVFVETVLSDNFRRDILSFLMLVARSQ